MPKRKSSSQEERWKKKIKKYETKLRRKSSRIIYSSDEEIDPDVPPPLEDLLVPEIDEQVGDAAEVAPGNPEPAVQPPEPAPPAVPAAREPPEPVQQAANVPVPTQPELDLIDPELLQAIGDFVPEAADWGDDINDNLAKIWSPILKDGLKKETKEEIIKKYLLPKNCQLTKSPTLNPEISAMLTESAKNRYIRIFKKQNQLGCVLSILGKTITGMLRKSLDTQGALKLLSEASKLIADSHFTETETRRALITPLLEKSFVEGFKDRKRDSHLFGDKLGDFIKSSRGIKKSGQLIQAVSTSASSLNWKGPPHRHFQRGSRAPLNRNGAGGPRALPPHQQAPRWAASAPAAPAGPPTPARVGHGAHHAAPAAAAATASADSAPLVHDAGDAQALEDEGGPSNASTPFPGCVHLIRQAFAGRQVPESTLGVMLSSLSHNTISQYSSSLKLWWEYCSKKGIEALDIQIFYVLDFLTECLGKGASYGTLNSHRSALSLISKNNWSQDDRIKRFFKGVFKIKPTFPKYSYTWDPTIVLNYLSKQYPHDNLTLEIISKKLVVLLALATGQRCQTLSLIKVSNINVSHERIVIYIKDLIKTSGIGKKQPILDLPFFRQRTCVCPARTLLDYMEKTSLIRPINEDKLILTSRSPYHGVSSQTIARWIKQTLSSSGIDTSTFSAHSTRHASTSAAARAGVSVDAIRKTAGWSETSLVFANFYKLPILEHNLNSSFANAVFE